MTRTRRPIPWSLVALGLIPLALAVSPRAGSAAASLSVYPIPSPAGQPLGIAPGPDGALWFTESAANKIGRISTGGQLTEFAIPTAASAPAGIVAGPDGALWFTETNANQVGRISTGGRVVEFPLAGSPQPTGIAAGADGALWFTETAANRIGRITTSGAVAELPLPALPAGSGPLGIAAGPDGALWFTEPSAGADQMVGRMTLGGVVTEFTLPTANSRPLTIAAGPDGALWFTENAPVSPGGGGQIGRVTVSGVLSEYALSADAGQPLAIAAGPDGALWFTLQNGTTSQIGRISTTGALSGFVLPAAETAAAGIATGPDNAVWFAEQATNQIGRIAGIVALTSITLLSSANPSVPGETLTFTAIVACGGATAIGAVTFSDGGVVLGAIGLDPSGTAALSAGGMVAGGHAITASFSGDANCAAATSGTVFQQVGVPPGPVGFVPVLLVQPVIGLTVTVSGCGSVANQTPGGPSLVGTSAHAVGDVIAPLAVPCSGYTFAGWIGGGPGCDGLTLNPCQLVMPPTGATLLATFVPAVPAR